MACTLRAAGRLPAGGGASPVLVFCGFLPAAGRLLRAAAGTRGNGRRDRAGQAAMGIHPDPCRHAGHRPALWLGSGPAAAPGSAGERLRHHCPGAGRLSGLDCRWRFTGRGARSLCLGQRLQPGRRLLVLDRHGRQLRACAGAAPVRHDRRRRQQRRAGRSDDHGPVGACRRRAWPAAGVGRLDDAVAAVHPAGGGRPYLCRGRPAARRQDSGRAGERWRHPLTWR
jgi:hypothetical protein